MSEIHIRLVLDKAPSHVSNRRLWLIEHVEDGHILESKVLWWTPEEAAHYCRPLDPRTERVIWHYY